MRIAEIKRGRWALYDENDKVVLIATNKTIVMRVMENKFSER